MKAVVQNLKNGDLQVDDVPPPALRSDGILVEVKRSLISIGTERAIIALAKKGPLGKARDRPDLARKVINKAKQEGYWNTYQVVKNLISSPIPLGYSTAGCVIEVGSNVTEFRIGDRVACAGLNYANHAEVNYIPRNLAAKVPEGVSFDRACMVTVGAIAMQGVRLARLELGDRVVVMGLGLVGQITAQLARCAGAVVLASDVDRKKLDLARDLGAHKTAAAAHLANAVSEFTDGNGADAVVVCAAAKSDELINVAAEISRLKGRVVVIGDVGMHIERRAFYDKEIELIVSRSYGPGRYDPEYETRGIDYPLPYVRWTEGRNMQSFLGFISRDEVRVEPLITHRFPIGNAKAAYEVVTGEKKEPAIGILLEYGDESSASGDSSLARRVEIARTPPRPIDGKISIGIIGAGQFAKGVLMPAFQRHKDVQLRAFCTSSGLTSKSVAERYGADYCTSDPQDIFSDDKIDAVVIATRHNEHAVLTMEAIRAGKAVFVEKPLALSEHELAQLRGLVENEANVRCMVGYNRRFSPLAVRAKQFFEPRSAPLFLAYRVNAGSFPSDSWVYDPVEGGGRILGEVCHFVDFICYLTNEAPERVHAEELVVNDDRRRHRDSVTITLRMSNNSIGTIHYLANGDASAPKEYCEVFGGQRTALLNNYRSLQLHSDNRCRKYRLLNQAKGHKEEVASFLDCLRSGDAFPIDLPTLIAVTQTTILVHRSLDAGKPVQYRPPRASDESVYDE